MADKIEKVISVQVDGVERALASFEAIEEQTKLIKNYLQETGRSLPEAKIKQMAKSFVDAKNAAAQLEKEIKDTNSELDKSNTKAKGLGRNLREAFRSIGSDAIGGGGVSGLIGGILGGGLFSLLEQGVTALLDWAFAAEEASVASESLTKNTESLTQGYAEEKVQLDSLFAPLFDVNLGTEERSRLIDEIESKYGEYIGDIDLETASQEDLAKAYRNVNNAIIDNLISKTKAKNLEEQFNLIAQKQIQIEAERQRLLNIDFVGSSLENQTRLRFEAIENSTVIKQLTQDIEDLTNAFNENAEVIDNAGEALKSIGLDFGNTTGTTVTFNTTTTKTKKTVQDLTTDLKDLDSAIQAVNKAIAEGASTDELEALGQLVQLYGDKAEEATQAATKITGLSGRTQKQIKDENILLEDQQRQVEATAKSEASLITTFVQLGKSIDDSGRNLFIYRDAVTGAELDIKKFTPTLRGLLEESENLGEFFFKARTAGFEFPQLDVAEQQFKELGKTYNANVAELQKLQAQEKVAGTEIIKVREKVSDALASIGDELTSRTQKQNEAVKDLFFKQPQILATVFEQAGVSNVEAVKENLRKRYDAELEISLQAVQKQADALQAEFKDFKLFGGDVNEGFTITEEALSKLLPDQLDRVKTLLNSFNKEISLNFKIRRDRDVNIDQDAWDEIVKNAANAAKAEIRQLKANQKTTELTFKEEYERLFNLDKEFTDDKRANNEEFNEAEIQQLVGHAQELIALKNQEIALELEAETDKYIKLIEAQKGNAEQQIIILQELQNKRREIILNGQKDIDNVTENFNALLKKGSEDSFDSFKEVWNAVTPILQNIAQAIDNIFQIIINEQQKVVDSVQERLSQVDTQLQETLSRISELEADLEGKRSGRREAILRGIQEEKEAEARLTQQKIDLANKLAREEEKLARKRKQAALTQAIINGAVAITSLNASIIDPTPVQAFRIAANIALAAVIGTQIALIASQKFAEGGFTSDGQGGKRDETGHIPVGVVHNDEYVVPKWMVKSPKYRPIIDNLESVRKRGFAEGGFTTPDYAALSDSASPNSNNRVMSIVQRSVDAAIALSERPIIANPVEFTNVERTMARRVQATTIGG